MVHRVLKIRLVHVLGKDGPVSEQRCMMAARTASIAFCEMCFVLRSVSNSTDGRT